MSGFAAASSRDNKIDEEEGTSFLGNAFGVEDLASGSKARRSIPRRCYIRE